MNYMNCEVCQKNPGVARCKKCGKVICKNCGRYCPSCKSAVCISHLRKLENGKWACELCIQNYKSISLPSNVPTQPTKSPSSTPKQPVKESLSFEDLTKEIGEVRIKIPGAEEESIEKESARVELKSLNPIDEDKGEVINPFAEEVAIKSGSNIISNEILLHHLSLKYFLENSLNLPIITNFFIVLKKIIIYFHT